MQKQTLTLKNLHAGFCKDGVDMFSSAVKREDVEQTTGDVLHAQVSETRTSNGHEYQHVISVMEVTVDAGDVKKALGRITRNLKKDFPELDFNVPVKYEYSGFRID